MANTMDTMDTMQADKMDAENIMPPPAAPAPTSGACESNDTRDRRIASGKLYSGGVASWRTQVAATTGPAEERSSTARARVFVRVRPLFEHEADRGEWECVSTGELRTVATRCTSGRLSPSTIPRDYKNNYVT